MSKDMQPLVSLFRVGISIHNFNKKSEEKIGLSLVQWCLLEQLIDMPGTSAQVLAKSVGVHPSTLTQTLKRLEKKGLLYQAEDPKDSRKKIISITKDGKHAMERIASQMSDWSMCFAPVSNDIRRLNSVLQDQVNQST